MKPIDRIGFRNWRSWATARAEGKVLEIGAGTGMNFSHYGADARVIAFDPDLEMLGKGDGVQSGSSTLERVCASAEAIPFPDDYFDSAVGTLVMCTIPHPEVALAEICRVCKPGANIRLVEHVRSHNMVLGPVMDLVTPFWKRVAGGCHLNRDTLETVRAAGLSVTRVQHRFGGLLIGIQANKPTTRTQ